MTGTYRRHLTLASEDVTMTDDRLPFQLVLWTREKHLSRHLSGVAPSEGAAYWSFGRKRRLGGEQT
ncbi:hypothetical protein [Neorhizobium sp. LjRoot104]|uniref:hypothetical protein n=1 Tax=Neorhizobium sp. LjRoot104 TaxID=3342254 RepID=UPI003F5046AC